MIKRKFKLGDKVTLPEDGEDYTVGEVVEVSTFKPDGKKASDFKEGTYGSFTCGVVWQNQKSAFYYFEENLNIYNGK